VTVQAPSPADLFQLDCIRAEALQSDGTHRVLCLDVVGNIVAPDDPTRTSLRILQALGSELTVHRKAIRLMFRLVTLREAFADGRIDLVFYLAQTDQTVIELWRFLK